MSKKLSKFYKKNYTAKAFEKKLSGKVFLKDEKELILSAYDKKDDQYFLKEGIDAESVKKLNRLIPLIKKNSGAVGTGKLIPVAVIAASFSIFTIFFQNPLAEKGMEKALEKIFEGESEVTELRLSLFSGYIRYGSLQVADKDDPDRNLFQTGEAVIDLDMPEVLKGRFAAEEITLADFQIDSKRDKRAKPLIQSDIKSSDRAAETGDKDKTSIASILPAGAVPDKDTVRKAIRENMDRLTAASAADAVSQSLQAGTERLKAQIVKTESEIADLKKETAAISDTKLSSKLDIAGAKKLAGRIKTASSSVSSINSGINASRKEAELLKKTAAEGKTAVENAVSKDIEFIASLFPGGGSFTVSSLAEPLVRERLDPLMSKYGKAFDIIMKIRESGKESGDGGKKSRASEAKRGRDIVYTVYGTPSFHIEKTAGSFLTGDKRHALEITDITNDQELLGRPMIFKIDSEIDRIRAAAEGLFDTRSSAQYFSVMTASVTGGKIAGAAFLSPAGINKFDSDMDIKLSTAVSADREFRGNAGITLKNMQLDSVSAAGRIIKNIIEKEENIDFDASYTFDGKKLSFKLRSTLDDVIARAISPENAAAEIKGFAMDEIQSILKEKSGLQADALKQLDELTARRAALEAELKAQKGQLDARLKTLPKF
jgi:uncharacterized protein (TIGR03545 family)